jgi:hypothetical protein
VGISKDSFDLRVEMTKLSKAAALGAQDWRERPLEVDAASIVPPKKARAKRAAPVKRKSKNEPATTNFVVEPKVPDLATAMALPPTVIPPVATLAAVRVDRIVDHAKRVLGEQGALEPLLSDWAETKTPPLRDDPEEVDPNDASGWSTMKTKMRSGASDARLLMSVRLRRLPL